ncbi:MAG: T9SS type A sorting domain-containing protein [Bacteroidota bacterium]
MYSIRKTLISILLIVFSHALSAQVQWTYSTNPALMMDTTVQWASYGQPSCILKNDTLKMWYAVAIGTDQFDLYAKGRIHYAWSLDGANWNKYSSNPVLDTAGIGQWDGQWLDTPEILWDGNEYKLYYWGDSLYPVNTWNSAIGLATSPDGIHWTRQGKVLVHGEFTGFDGYFVESPALYYDTLSGVYAMLYMGVSTSSLGRVGLAVSPDGYTWYKDPANPALDTSSTNYWEEKIAGAPAVIETKGVFEMFYSGACENFKRDSAKVGYALSLNGSDWIRYPGNPILETLPGDAMGFWAVDVVWHPGFNEYMMWFEDTLKYGANAIYFATAPRTVLFSPSCITSVSPDTSIVSGNSVQLTAAGGSFYQWSPATGLNNPNIANPIATPTVTTTYRVLNVSNSCITVDTVTVTVLPVGVKELTKEAKEMKLYPNPSSENIIVELKTEQNEDYDLTVNNVLGEIVLKRKVQKTERTISLDVSDLPAGLYFVKFQNFSGKFVKQ